MPLSYRCFKTIVCAIVLIFVAGVCFGQQKPARPEAVVTPDKIIKRIADSIESINKKLPIEKIFIHTDRNSYNIGDTIWFKAYVIDRANNSLSNLNNILYLQLSDDSANVIDRISIRMKNGVGWGQMAIRKIQYPEGNYILRAYNMWSANFNYNFIYTQRFYFTAPIQDTWLVSSTTNVTRVDNKNQLKVSLLLNHADKQLSPVVLKDVEVKIYDGDHYFYKEEMRTGIDGSLNFSSTLKDKVNGQKLWAQITSLDPIDTNKIVPIPLQINRSQKIDLQFLPEGGKLVAGLKSTVGFKAVGEDGTGALVSGGVFDSKGNKVIDFKALHDGMGSFEMTPQSGETYTAKISGPQDVPEQYQLPKAEVIGTVMHVSNLEKLDVLKISLAGLSSLPADSGFVLTGMARGTLCYAQNIDANQKEITIEKKLFPTGVVRFTLFKGLTPINERIVFIDHHDQLHVSIKPHKPRYDKRDSVSLDIEVKDKDGEPVEGNFSLSVTDGSQVKPDSTGDFGIAVNFLIASEIKGDYGKVNRLWVDFMRRFMGISDEDLKGEIESPGYYINRSDEKVWQALDNLMLTQGWVDYRWKDVFSVVEKSKYDLQNTVDITGKVITPIRQHVINKGLVMLTSQKPAFVRTVPIDLEGKFVFKDLLKLDTGSFFFQVLTLEGKPIEAAEIIVDRPLKTRQFAASYRYPVLPWYVNADSTAINLARRRIEQANAVKPYGPGTILREVNIKEKKIIRGSFNTLGPKAKSDYIFDEQDIKRSGLTNLYDFLFQKIPRLQLTYSIGNDGQFRLHFLFNHRFVQTNIDGLPLMSFEREADANSKSAERRIEELSKYSLGKIKGIEMMYDYEGMHDKLRRAMAITTFDGEGGVRHVNVGTTSYRPLPITVPKTFYSPKYNVKLTAKTLDYRPTLHWEPNIITDKNGKATVSFYTSDSVGDVIFNLQGIGADGELGSFFYQLKR